nr:hypothetical protein GCM10020092_082860 [Actinoplanes digitatis]
MNSFDIISMPDPWEYPWYAAWDLAFHCVSIARVDPGFAKSQLLLLLREWYMHPNGQIPAYEWSFGDVNPPVHAWAALRVFEIDGGRDHDFLARIMHKLLLNFTWWVNRKDVGGNNVFEGGFLGLDNVGPFDRSAALPVAGVLEQSDGTGWMAMYALNLLDMSIRLALHDRTYEDMVTKFFEHFAYIAEAAYRQGLWDDEDCFFYDVLRLPDGHRMPLKARSIVGLLPLAATTTLSAGTLNRLPGLGARLRWLLANAPEYADVISARRLATDGRQQRLLSMVGQDQLLRILARMLDPEEFLSPYGLRTLSRAHREKPFTVSLGGSDFTVGYEPAESTSGLFGGNSNWRGPVWMPTNYLLIEALREFAAFYGPDLMVEYPTGSQTKMPLSAVADDLSRRLISLFVPDSWGAQADVRRHGDLPEPSGLEGPARLPRVLQRRRRRGPRRLASDRLDGTCGGSDSDSASIGSVTWSSVSVTSPPMTASAPVRSPGWSRSADRTPSSSPSTPTSRPAGRAPGATAAANYPASTRTATTCSSR